jgi:hypothetical protein
MKLQDLTDAHVRALLSLNADALMYLAAVSHTPGIRWGRDEWRRALIEAGAIRTDLEHGDDPLPLADAFAEAQRIADGLTDRQVANLEAIVKHDDGEAILARSAGDDVVRMHLASRFKGCIFSTPLGRLVLALRNRKANP